MNFWIDTHAHIYSDEFKNDRADMLARCEQHGIGKIYMPNVDHTSIDAMFEVERISPERFVPMMGLHPCSVKKDFERELYIVEDWLAKRKFSAVGEIGTDLHWDKTFWEQQKEAFKIQVQWALRYELPIVIHCRETIDETIEMVEHFQNGKLTGIFHCYSGNLQQAERIAKQNFFLGIGGVATFKNSGLDKVLQEISLDNIVLETDSPYLAPVPHRGKRNEPSYIPLVAAKIADLKNITLDEIQKVTTQNAMKLFKL